VSRELLSSKFLAIWNSRFKDIPQYCETEDVIGVDEVPEWRDWTNRETTPDQTRIETYLCRSCSGNEKVLHVGIGNSLLASRFSSVFSLIVGISITEHEVETAISKKIHNYYPILMNKYSSTFENSFGREFDIIIDNNPTSFSCCVVHFERMLETYSRILKKDGRIITDKVGLNFVSSAPEANRRWKFNFEDWVMVTELFGMITEVFDDYTYVTKFQSSPGK
jgi:hypothetical protein